jgi:large subunit ribosomal protein L24
MHVKKGDTVLILSGDDKGKTGKIVKAFPSEGKVLIEGVNTVKKHERANKQGQKGQVVTRAMPIYASKVMKTDVVKKKK